MLKIRTYVVIIVVQFILMAMFLIYAIVQRTQALKNEEAALRGEKLAEAAQVEALKQAEVAQATVEALKKQLDACMMRK